MSPMHQDLNYFSWFHKSNLDRTIVSKFTVLPPNIQKALVSQNLMCIKWKTF